jgi:bacteriocin-like protein
MNTGEKDRELSDDKLNQVTGGGPVAHQAYQGSPLWISNTMTHWEVPTMTSLNYPFPLP